MWVVKPMENQPTKRTVSPDAEAIKRLRRAKGWRVEDLATKAICSVKTVENVERGAHVYVSTLAKVAKGLGVEFMTLVQGDKPPQEPQEPPKPQPHVRMVFELSIPFDQFDESEQLGGFIDFLKKFMKGGGDINVLGVTPGSTIIPDQIDRSVSIHPARVFCRLPFVTNKVQGGCHLLHSGERYTFRRLAPMPGMRESGNGMRNRLAARHCFVVRSRIVFIKTM